MLGGLLMASRKSPYKGPDRFTIAAKKQGYPARSIFKLEEIDRRVQLLRPGSSVLDLGAAPGSWSLYAAQKVGPQGRLVAMDLSPLNTALPRWATFFQGDAFDPEAEAIVLAAPYDVVLSDMAPNTTGNRLSDQTRSFDLYMRALEVALRFLKPGGHFVGKIFMGEDFPVAQKATKARFAEERVIRPEGTRSVSYEVFLIGLGLRSAQSTADAPVGAKKAP
jgi:23S rRNA (uridine2552-2'-O)-methyltransferase